MKLRFRLAVLTGLLALGLVFFFEEASGQEGKSLAQQQKSQQGQKGQKSHKVLKDQEAQAQKEGVYRRLQSFVQALDLVKKYYYEDVPQVKLVEGAIKGVMAELDHHTVYLNPQDYKRFKSRSSGAFWGVGLEFSVDEDKNLLVISPVENSPAWKAGILSGDKILSINGISVQGLTFVDISNMITSKEKKVDFLIKRATFKRPKLFRVTKDVIRVRPVRMHDFGQGHLFLRISDFTQDTASDIESFLKAYVKKNGKISGLLLDLRYNPGGLLEEAVKVGDLFLKGGVLVSTKGRTQESQKIYRASGKGKYLDFPIVILVNQGTASAGEVLAAALRENDRAFLVGAKTFGKGSVQSILELEDGAAVKMTIALFYTPKGNRIHTQGLTPDVVMEMPSGKVRVFSKEAMMKDVAVQKALSHLKILAEHQKSLKKKL